MHSIDMYISDVVYSSSVFTAQSAPSFLQLNAQWMDYCYFHFHLWFCFTYEVWSTPLFSHPLPVHAQLSTSSLRNDGKWFHLKIQF